MLLPMGGNVFECFENGGWNGRDMTTLGLESVLVSHVGHLDNFTVWRGVAVTALSLARLSLGAWVVKVADLLCLDTIRRLVTVTVASVWIWAVRALPQNGNRRGRRVHTQRNGGCHGSEGA